MTKDVMRTRDNFSYLRRRHFETALSLAFLSAFLFSGNAAALDKLQFAFQLGPELGGKEKMSRPSGVAVSDEGKIFVTDTDNHRVAIFTSEGKFEKTFGKKGGKEGEFKEPWGIALSKSSRLFVADRGNDRVQVFDIDGKFLYSIGHGGSDRGELDEPRGIALDDQERVFVVDSGNRSVAVFSEEGVFLDRFGLKGEGKGQFEGPVGVATDRQGYIYITDEKNRSLQIFSPNLTFDRSFQAQTKEVNPYGVPIGLSVDSFGNILYTDGESKKLLQVSRKGEMLPSFGSQGKGRGQFDEPRLLHLDVRSNTLYIVDSKNDRVQVMKGSAESKEAALPKASTLRRIRLEGLMAVSATGIAASGDGKIYLLDSKKGSIAVSTGTGETIPFGVDEKGKSLVGRPEGIALAGDETIYISDSKNDKVHVFGTEGKKIFEFGGSGKKDGNFRTPRGLAFYQDQVIVADNGNSRIQLFTKDGIFIRAFGGSGKGAGQFSGLEGVAVNSKGEIFAVDSENHRVTVFDAKGKMLRTFGAEGMFRGAFYQPKSIEIDSRDQVFVLDGKKGSRVQVFDGEGRFIYTFGSEGEGRTEMKDAVALSAGFSEGTILYIADPEPGRVQVIKILDVAEKPEDLEIKGEEKGSRLSWKRSDDPVLVKYRVYSRGEDGSFEVIGETEQNSYEISYDAGQKRPVYAVAALAYGDLESDLSAEVQDYFRLGYVQHQKGDFREAARHFREGVDAGQASGDSLYYLGEAYVALQEYNKAAAAFQDLSKLAGFELKGQFRLGEVYQIAGEREKALELFKEILKKDPAQWKAKVAIGEIYYKDALYQPALEMLKGVIDGGNGDVRAHELLGRIYLQSKILSKAQLAFENAIAINPDAPTLHKGLAEVFEAEGMPERAVQSYNKAAGLDPADAATFLKLASLYLDLGKNSEAANSINAALKLTPDSSAAFLLRGRLLMAEGKGEDAVITCKKILAENPNDREALLLIAEAYAGIGQLAEGLGHLDRLSKLFPNDPAPFFKMGQLRKKGGDADGALKSFNGCIKANGGRVDCRREAALIYVEKGNLDEAMGYLQEAVKQVPEDREAKIALAEVQNKLGRTGEAIVQMEDVLKADEKNGKAHHLLGRIYLENKQYERATRHLKTATTLFPNLPEYQNSLGLAYMAQMLLDDAINAFKKACAVKSEQECQENLNQAYEKKKTMLAASEEAPPLAIDSVEIGNVFASIYKSYTDTPIGTLRLKNNSDAVFSDVKINFIVKKYMDFAFESVVRELKPQGTVDIPIKPTFNNQLLGLTEDTSIQAEIEASYFYLKKPQAVKSNRPFTVFNRNAMTWKEKRMASAFITPKDAPVVDFARGIIQMFNGENSLIDENLYKAVQLFDALGAMGIIYLVDPNNPYASISVDYDRVDSIQYPRDTLRLKTGDCDDLSVLYAALLENVGVETALLDIPGHLFMAFRTQTPADKAESVAASSDRYIIRDGFVWIPVEATMIGKTFSEAWYEGANEAKKRLSEESLKYVDSREAWRDYKPVTIDDALSIPLPERGAVLALLEKDLLVQKKKFVEKLAVGYKERLKANPADKAAQLNLGILYGRKGYFEDARVAFETALAANPNDPSAINNLGNLLFMQKKFTEALAQYEKAEGIDKEDGGIKMNMALVYYKLGEIEKARQKYREGEAVSPASAAEHKLLKSLLFD